MAEISRQYFLLAAVAGHKIHNKDSNSSFRLPSALSSVAIDRACAAGMEIGCRCPTPSARPSSVVVDIVFVLFVGVMC